MDKNEDVESGGLNGYPTRCDMCGAVILSRDDTGGSALEGEFRIVCWMCNPAWNFLGHYEGLWGNIGNEDYFVITGTMPTAECMERITEFADRG